mgnify:CR=1 FL=1
MNIPASVHTSLPQLVELLRAERREQDIAVSTPDDPKAQWDVFRALVNTRPPLPASDEFLALQDELLRDIIAHRGITRPEDIEPCPCDSRIALWRGDITTLAVDAIVNAANSQMLGCFVPGHFCIDNAIHTFAGVQLRIECARLMDEQGYAEPTGMAKVTDAFNLPSRYIIHTVGPIAQGAPSDLDRALLANCYTACLDAADELGCESIAFCCISTGVFGFPQEQAAPIAVRTVEEWLDAHPDTPVKRVIFNVFSERDEKVYERLLA